jgi:hypothetical protein
LVSPKKKPQSQRERAMQVAEDAQLAWYNLEKAVEAVQEYERTGSGDYLQLLATVRAGIYLLLEHPPEEVLAQVEASALPTRPTASWLVFEALRIPDLPRHKVEALREAWARGQAARHGELMPPPPTWLGV